MKRRIIRELRELENILDQLKLREPFGFELAGENGLALILCITSICGSVPHATSNNEPPYLLAVAPGTAPVGHPGGKSPHAVAMRADSEIGIESPVSLVAEPPLQFRLDAICLMIV
jgi:hypothetical protein